MHGKPVLAAALAILLGSPAEAQPVPLTPTPPPVYGPTTTIVAASDAHTRMTVPVTIGASGPYAFIVDTGADRTVVSRELADTLGLQPGPSALMHSMAGVGAVGTVVVEGLALGGGKHGRINAPALAEAHLGARGLLGVDSLQGQRVVMDFHKGTLSIADAKTRDVVTPGTIVVTARSRYGQLILVDADVGGVPITVIVDSGAQNSIGNLALRRLLQRRGKVVPAGKTDLIDVTGAQMSVDLANVDNIRIGGVTLSGVGVAFGDAHPFRRFGLLKHPALLLGVETLRAFRRVSVDFAARKVRFLLPGEV